MASTMNCSECGQRLEAADEEALREQLTVHMAEVHPDLEVTEEEIQEMVEESMGGASLVKLGDSDVSLETPEQDVRSHNVFDSDGEELGTVEELYFDEESRSVRFLEVHASGTTSSENRRFLIPMEAVSESSGDRVELNIDRQKIEGSPGSPTGRVPSLGDHEESQRYYGFGAYHD